MEIWTSIAAHVVARFPYAVREASNALRFVVVLGGVHRVGIRLRCVRAYDAYAIVMTAELGTHDAIDGYDGLVTNLQLVTGALACEGHALVLRALVANEASFDAQLELFAREAATMKRTLTRPFVTHAASTMNHYAD